MRKKFLIALLSVICAITCALGLAACGGNSNESTTPVEPSTFTVTFETNGGTVIDPITASGNKTLKDLLDGKTTEKEDKVFVCWYKDSSLSENAQVSLNSYIKSDTTLYAAWRDYTDAEVLETAVKNTRNDAIAVHDSGTVRLNVTTSGYAVTDVTLTLENGVITAGSRGTSKFYKDNTFFYTSENQNIKLKEKAADTVTEFLYLNTIGTVDYKTHSFYSTFAPLSVFRFADAPSLSSFERDGDTFTVTYKGNDGGVGHNWKEENNPWLYFDAGKIFRFTVSNKHVVKVEQIASTTAKRTIEFFYDGDENIPPVQEPQDENSYVQKWQLKVNGRILLVTELNKAEIDEKVFGKDCAQITKKQTYYFDEEMKNEVNFNADGVAPLTEHITLYHETVNYADLVVDSFIFKLSKYDNDLTLDSTDTKNGIKVTTFIRNDDDSSGTFEISVEPSPWSANDKEFTVELVDIQNDELLTVESYVGSKSISVSKSITGEYRIKLTATTGGYTEYICIKPHTQAN